VGQKPALGKGLASLFPGATPPGAPAALNPATQPAQTAHAQPTFPEKPAAVMGTGAEVAGPVTPAQSSETPNRDRHPGISLAPPDEIQINPFQPRREFDEAAIAELAQSIEANGIIQPLVVRKMPDGKYQLIAGERRLRASKKLGLKQVPIVIRKSSDRESLELALIENIQRQELNCVDEALAYFQLTQDFNLTQEEVARRVGKERATVANHLRILKLPEAILDDLKRGILTFGHGKALLGLEDLDLRLRARAQVVEKRLSVRDTEALVEAMKTQPDAQVPGSAAKTEALTPIQQRLKNIAMELARKWSTRVEVKGSERRGKIVLHYANRQELDRILQAMQN
jgi:ParB family chromosome partitioning protein